MNRFLAREEICERREERSATKKLASKQAREKVHRQKRKQGFFARKRNVEKKRQHGQKKQNRRRPGAND